jgi:GMP synthase (glutamine-hydrolysing)
VAAALVQRAIGDRLTCVFVDHGLLRQGEAEQVEQDFVAATGCSTSTSRTQRALPRRARRGHRPGGEAQDHRPGVHPVFEAAEAEVFGEAAPIGAVKVGSSCRAPSIPTWSSPVAGAGTANIKSHHNVGGLPDDLEFALVEPLRTLFKDEVRAGRRATRPAAEIVWRQPFPGPGLGIRIIGAVDRERLDILRAADAIAREELTRAGLDRDIWQMPVVLLADVRSVGVQGDGRTYGHPVVLRPVTSEDAMTADWARLPYDVLERISTRITNEVPRSTGWCSTSPDQAPGTIEWEWEGADGEPRSVATQMNGSDRGVSRRCPRGARALMVSPAVSRPK